MALYRFFIAAKLTENLRRGDVVLHVAKNDRMTPRTWAHLGLVEDDLRRTASDIGVFHMSDSVARSTWLPPSGKVTGEQNRVDAAGTDGKLSDWTRDDIMREAMRYAAMQVGNHELLWFGPPQPSSDDPNAPYRFSCATLVNHCYRVATRVDIVDVESLPQEPEDQIQALRSQLNGPPESAVPPDSFRRLYPGYIARAFDVETFPFDAQGAWHQYQDHRWILEAR